ncbi:protein translocase subunit yajC [Desulfuromusa kysingii]|uniref:Sec translocon accessory complex subunit YajC n=1 Tax=Desulfuromusa kysingii TaxID=37625 RepID=A0A1H3YC16_9BACT|nr:preprotein translocase subunit YajC [Desulfuromusa kysingii]SEA09106.1 protein translocase subunit yajC [Desulfuromusa kysingii]
MATEAFAMAGGAAAQGTGGQYQGIIMLVAMFAIFYFLLIRPQQKRAKQQRELVGGLKAGDTVVSAGGIHGKITAVDETTVTLEVATGVKIKMNRASITEVKQ